MIQLWLANDRIDSLAKLREAFAARDAEDRIPLCVELLEKMSADILIPWLDRCSETRPPDSAWDRERAAPLGGGTLASCRLQLGKEKDPLQLSSEGIAALASICEIDESTVRSALTGKRRQMRIRSCQSDELCKRIERQAWYRGDAAVQRMFTGIRWEQVAVNSATLNGILAQASKRSDGGKTDVYLCNVGEAFTLRSTALLRNLRIVGFGEPNVQFNPCARGEWLDLNERNLKFERFHLNCQGVRLRYDKSCCCDMTIV